MQAFDWCGVIGFGMGVFAGAVLGSSWSLHVGASLTIRTRL